MGDGLRFECEGFAGGMMGLGRGKGVGDARAGVWAGGLEEAGAVGLGVGGVGDFEVVTGDVEGLGFVYACEFSLGGGSLGWADG